MIFCLTLCIVSIALTRFVWILFKSDADVTEVVVAAVSLVVVILCGTETNTGSLVVISKKK